jgi:hypothetical protein
MERTICHGRSFTQWWCWWFVMTLDKSCTTMLAGQVLCMTTECGGTLCYAHNAVINFHPSNIYLVTQHSQPAPLWFHRSNRCQGVSFHKEDRPSTHSWQSHR